ncbi:uncharacterized protein TRAVEDRAFT_57526 [Trametes versicolor FP-101664 SS1]|uniref:uncharacterized protein n=1 Tax=Trametes versicolor (strain FP-101664) TaxID=717944 RepID=UPI0004624441|nr:uncharacterized protein TRAVEDRAFT_57526 [Trametes versicolor FP-101664 SS1]EIW60190.1 hypothetical protein TRAVEDRAFT_57526 [Trametes versicolor FP-101664 SS1]
MTGPPTPPPSSAVEIEDAARTMLPPPAAVPATEPVVPPADASEPEGAQPPPVAQAKQVTSYELLFPSISDMARNGSLGELIELAERGDLSAEYHTDPSRMLLVAPLVLAYMITDQLPAARHAMTRLPESLASYGLSQALFQVLASTHERKYSDVYRRAEELHEFVSQPAFADAALGQILAGMVASFIVSFRKKTFELLSTAYTSIPLPLAQWYLGYPGDKAEEVLNVALANNWKFDQTTRIFTPSTQPTTSSRGIGYTQSTLQALNLVADTVANLEA